VKEIWDAAQWLEANQAQFIQMSDEIWANPEVKWKEFKSSRLQADYMEEAGFEVTWDSGGISTAFVAEWKNEDGPVIGFAGEYDALPGLSQKNQPSAEPIEMGGAGHGCGHNLLGTGCLAAAVAVKNWLQVTGTPGTVRYYGCPAEEGGSGKVFMVRDGAFGDVDATFNFHPGYVNMASKGSLVGVNHVRFQFHGRTAHAGVSPHMGRSALDAVELMNVGVNYLREHVPTGVRLHYITTHGGQAPNIVPDFAEVYYYIRAHLPAEVADVTERVKRVAQGAAMMTETKMEMIYDSGTTCLLNNHILSDLQYEVMETLGPIEYTADELAYATEINKNMPQGNREYVQKMLNLTDEQVSKPLIGDYKAADDEHVVLTGSTDVGDVSWVSPLSMLRTTCWPVNAPGHSWGVVATGSMSIGHKGMMYAAKVMAVSALELYTNPAKLKAVREEFEARIARTSYVNPLPDDCVAPYHPHPLR
jgi:aminobenzoyl-glutamate utilization protein B